MVSNGFRQEAFARYLAKVGVASQNVEHGYVRKNIT